MYVCDACQINYMDPLALLNHECLGPTKQEPKLVKLMDAFPPGISKAIKFIYQSDNGSEKYRIGIKTKNDRTKENCIYISRLIEGPLVNLLMGKVDMKLKFATTDDLNSNGWQPIDGK